MSARIVLLLSLLGCTGPGPKDDDACTPVVWYRDGDADGYGVESSTTEACAAPSGYTAAPGDCDDADGTIHPGVDEVCGGADEDCDGLVDDADPGVIGRVPSFRDADRDGYGDDAIPVELCTVPDGFVELGGDCDDGDDTAYPTAPEVCDGVDNDCDQLTDDEDDDLTGAPSWYPDGDGDGYGDDDAVTEACEAPAGAIARGGDCDDDDDAVSPVATEACNGYDDDCDGLTDDEDAAVSGRTIWYLDADGDGYGRPESFTVACSAPEGYAGPSTDCDDTDADVNPGHTEVCDDKDNDCDGAVDQADTSIDLSTGTTAWPDDDEDGYGAVEGGEAFCDVPEGWVEDDTDCDDDSELRYPGAHERCSDSVDDDCDGVDLACASLADAPATFPGAHGGDAFGDAVCAGGDFTGDGQPDLVVAGLLAERASPTTPGLVAVYAGTPSGVLTTGDAVVRLWGDSGGDELGAAVAGGVDLDGDGLADLFAGAPQAAFAAGQVAFLYGGSTGDRTVADADARWSGERADDGFGSSLALPGDLDDDGQPDVVVGASGAGRFGSAEGAAYLWFTPPSGAANATTADVKLSGTTSGQHAGIAVAGAGDLDGDGIDDLVVADAPDAGGGSVYLLYGPLSGDSTLADAVVWQGGARSEPGRALAALGDTDGDGLSDLAVGDAEDGGAGASAGAVFVLPGPADAGGRLADAPLILRGEAANARAGTAVAAPGDLDGDGRSELLVGAPGEGTAGTRAGAFYVVPGGGSGVTTLATGQKILGTAAEDNAGTGLAVVGDLDGDGLSDWLVGSPERSGGVTYGGAAALWWGAPPE